MDKVIAKFHSRIESIRKMPIEIMPKKIEFIVSSNESTTQQEISAAREYCCPLCINRSIKNDVYRYNTCYICNRKCCNYCSFIEFNRSICKSKSCHLLNRFNKQEISLDQLFNKTRDSCHDNLIQWLVLQSNREIQLGPLRALLLIDILHSSLIHIDILHEHTADHFITSHLDPVNIEFNKRFMDINQKDLIFIKLPDDTLAQMTFVGDEKVSHVIKYLILHYYVGTSRGKIILYLNDIQLDSTQYLTDYNIQLGDTLRLSYILKGGKVKRHSKLNVIQKKSQKLQKSKINC
jgi:hypothetical protein